jgi:hypothetical protein
MASSATSAGTGGDKARASAQAVITAIAMPRAPASHRPACCVGDSNWTSVVFSKAGWARRALCSTERIRSWPETVVRGSGGVVGCGASSGSEEGGPPPGGGAVLIGVFSFAWTFEGFVAPCAVTSPCPEQTGSLWVSLQCRWVAVPFGFPGTSARYYCQELRAWGCLVHPKPLGCRNYQTVVGVAPWCSNQLSEAACLCYRSGVGEIRELD